MYCARRYYGSKDNRQERQSRSNAEGWTQSMTSSVRFSFRPAQNEETINNCSQSHSAAPRCFLLRAHSPKSNPSDDAIGSSFSGSSSTVPDHFFTQQSYN